MPINAISLISIFVDVSSNNQIISNATAFVYIRNDKKYLITNYHVAFGRRWDSNECLDKQCRLPDALILNFWNKHRPGEILHETIELPNDKNPFKFKKINGKYIDIAVLDLTNYDCVRENAFAVNESVFLPKTNLNISTGSSLFILGFPKGISMQYLPIWKRCTIASEPDLVNGIDYMPYVYVDTASRDGMSGAPVIFYSNTIASVIGQKNPITGGYQFYGIYSGRNKGDDEFEAQLGIVWEKKLIDEIIDENWGCAS